MSDLDFWNSEAATFDDAADHGLRDAAIRERWRSLLSRLLPQQGRVLDVGCGTGSLSLLMAEAGHRVTGIDFSPAMVEQALGKALRGGHTIDFHVGDAAEPRFAASTFDVVLGRHILWAIPDVSTGVVLDRWANLLKPGGVLVLIEGFWNTGAGLPQNHVVGALPETVQLVAAEDIASDDALWGGSVSDERYVVVARKS